MVAAADRHPRRLITALVIVRAPGGGGGVPADGLASGGLTPPNTLPGIILAAFATLGLGLALGPSSPVIALGAGVSVFLLRRVSHDAPEQVYLGLGSLTGLSTEAYAIQPLGLSSIGELTVPMFAWTLLLAPIAALIGHAVVQGGGGVARIVSRRPLLLVPQPESSWPPVRSPSRRSPGRPTTRCSSRARGR